MNTWLILGTLGSGKTTLIRHLLAQRPADERWGLLINDFGAIGIDEALSHEDRLPVETVSGGCICCGAQGDMQRALTRLAQSRPALDLLLIEPSGISEPETLLETLRRHPDVSLQGVLALLDAAQYDAEALMQWDSLRNMLILADIVLINKTDRVPADRVRTLEEAVKSLYPPKALTYSAAHARIPLEALRRSASDPSPRFLAPTSAHAACAVSDPPWQTLDFPYLERREIQQGHVWTAGWQWSDQARFDWRAMQRLFDRLGRSPFADTLRAKAVLRVNDRSWMAFQWAGGDRRRELSGWRKDSRLEIIVRSAERFDFAAFEKALGATQVHAADGMMRSAVAD